MSAGTPPAERLRSRTSLPGLPLAGLVPTLHAALRRPEGLRTETHSEITRPLPDRTE